MYAAHGSRPEYRVEIRHTAGCIEQPANRVTGVEQQQRVGCQRNDIDHAAAAKRKRRAARGQHIVRRQCEALEPRIHTLIMPDADMNLAALQQRHLIHPKSFHQLHAHIGEVFGIPRQEFRQDALDRLRRRRELEHAEVSALKQLDAFAERPHLAQHAAAICEQLLAPGGQKKTAADPVKKLESTFVFEIADLPRKSGLADARTQRRLRPANSLNKPTQF
jgi:hypothetical protein